MRVALWLTRSERFTAERVAREREKHPRGRHLSAFARSGNYETNHMGVVAEIAAARAYRATPDLHVGSGDDGADFTTPNGTRYQVKSYKLFSHPRLSLMVNPRDVEDGHSSDVYVMCSVDARQGYVELVGWAAKGEVLAAPFFSMYRGMELTYNIAEVMLHPCEVVVEGLMNQEVSQ